MIERRAGLPILVALAAVLALPYLPTLAAPFDFVDDGCLVYPESGPLLERVGRKTVSEFQHRGPFRPVTWFHWEVSAALFGDHPLPHRMVHLAGTMLAAFLMLLWFRELGLPIDASFAAAAGAFWGPFRSEVGIGLGMTEAFAAPYALFALWATTRAVVRPSSVGWDFAAWTTALLAIGCKNTFAAIVPAMMLLRMIGLNGTLREGWRLQGRRALALGTVLVFPVVHFIAFKLHPLPKEYGTSPASLTQLGRWGTALLRAAALEYVGVAVALMMIGILVTRRFAKVPSETSLRSVAYRKSNVFAVAALLTLAGVGIYLPINGMAGRYTLPAAWGLDLALATLVAVASTLPRGWRIAIRTTFALGLLTALGTTIGRVDKAIARSQLFWKAVAHLETNAPPNATLAWLGEPLPRGDEIGIGEGIHFGWHLEHRGRCSVHLIAEAAHADYAMTGPATPPPGTWNHVADFHSSSHSGAVRYQCHLWKSVPAKATMAR